VPGGIAGLSFRLMTIAFAILAGGVLLKTAYQVAAHAASVATRRPQHFS
jgi:hypothetical protein